MLMMTNLFQISPEIRVRCLIIMLLYSGALYSYFGDVSVAAAIFYQQCNTALLWINCCSASKNVPLNM